MKLTGIQDKLSDQFDSRRAQFPASRGLSRRGKIETSASRERAQKSKVATKPMNMLNPY